MTGATIYRVIAFISNDSVFTVGPLEIICILCAKQDILDRARTTASSVTFTTTASSVISIQGRIASIVGGAVVI